MLLSLLTASVALTAHIATPEIPVRELGSLAELQIEAVGADSNESGSRADVLAVKAKHLHLGDGRVIEDGVLVVTDGIVSAAGKVAVPTGARVIEHDGHVSPGLVAAHSQGYLPWNESNESTRPFLPDGRVVHGFDIELPRLADALAAGVTTLVLVPAETQVVGGRTAVVKTSGGSVITPNAHLAVSMTSAAANTSRYPTSYAGIVRELDARFTEPAGAYAEAKSGNLGLYVAVNSRHEVDRALRFMTAHGLRGTLAGPALAGELAKRIEAATCSVILPGTGFAPNERTLHALRDLAAANVPFAFELNDPQSFRTSAAVALRAGASAAEAMGSISWTAADIARVGTSVGRLDRGLDGDFVLWSGEPIDLTSKVVSVYVNGVLAHGAAQ